MRRHVLYRGVAVLAVMAVAVFMGSTPDSGILRPQAAHVTAAPLGNPTWISGIQVQNLDPVNTANIVIKYYNRSNGSLVSPSQTDQIPAGQSKTYFANSMAVPAGFVGSAVVESDTRVAATVNEIADPPYMTASYGGVSSAATSFFLPLIMRNNAGWNTTIHVQNADSSATANIQIGFRGPTNYDMPTFSLLAGQSREIPQSTMTQLTSSNGRWVGSATITSDRPVAAVVNQTDGNILLGYSGFTSGGSKVYAPLLMNNNNGWYTGFQVMNIGGSSATVNLKVDGVVKDTVVIPSQSSKTWYPIPGMTTKVAAGSAEGTTGSEQLVGMVNEIGPNYSGGPVAQGSSYNAFNSGTSKVFAPLLMANNAGWYTSFQVMNIGSSVATVRLVVDGAQKDQVSIDPGKVKVWYPIPGMASKVGYGYVQGVNGTEQLVGVVNELNSGTGDNLMTYEGINQ